MPEPEPVALRCIYRRVCDHPDGVITADDFAHERVVVVDGRAGHLDCGARTLRLHHAAITAGREARQIAPQDAPVLVAAATRAVQTLDVSGTGSLAYDL